MGLGKRFACNRKRGCRPSRFRPAVFLTPLLLLVCGCVGFGVVDGLGPGTDDGALPPDGNGSGPGDGEAQLAVTIRVSNPTPQPNEQVILTCSLVNTGVPNVTFSFQPSDGGLVVDPDAGTASFIVQEFDVGLALTYTCTASDENGPGEPSNSLTIIVSP